MPEAASTPPSSTPPLPSPSADRSPSSPSSLPPAPAAADATSPGGLGTILLVEADEDVREVAAHVLGVAGYVVRVAANTAEALRLAGEKGPVHLLLADTSLPDAVGLALRLRFRYPNVQAIFLSVYPTEVVCPPRLRGAAAPVLLKPFGAADLLAVVRQALAGTAAC